MKCHHLLTSIIDHDKVRLQSCAFTKNQLITTLLFTICFLNNSDNWVFCYYLHTLQHHRKVLSRITTLAAVRPFKVVLLLHFCKLHSTVLVMSYLPPIVEWGKSWPLIAIKILVNPQKQMTIPLCAQFLFDCSKRRQDL